MEGQLIWQFGKIPEGTRIKQEEIETTGWLPRPEDAAAQMHYQGMTLEETAGWIQRPGGAAQMYRDDFILVDQRHTTYINPSTQQHLSMPTMVPHDTDSTMNNTTEPIILGTEPPKKKLSKLTGSEMRRLKADLTREQRLQVDSDRRAERDAELHAMGKSEEQVQMEKKARKAENKARRMSKQQTRLNNADVGVPSFATGANATQQTNQPINPTTAVQAVSEAMARLPPTPQIHPMRLRSTLRAKANAKLNMTTAESEEERKKRLELRAMQTIERMRKTIEDLMQYEGISSEEAQERAIQSERDRHNKMERRRQRKLDILSADQRFKLLAKHERVRLLVGRGNRRELYTAPSRGVLLMRRETGLLGEGLGSLVVI